MTLRPRYLPMSICFATSDERFMVTVPLRVPSYVFVADGSQKDGKGKNDPISTPLDVFVSQPPYHDVQRRADG